MIEAMIDNLQYLMFDVTNLIDVEGLPIVNAWVIPLLLDFLFRNTGHS